MSLLDTVTSTFSKAGGQESWGQSGSSDKGHNTGNGGYESGGHENGYEGGQDGGSNSSFDLSSLAKNLDVDSSLKYDKKDYSESTDYKKEASYDDRGGSTVKESSDHESVGKGGEKYESSSEYKYSDKDFGESKETSESYSHEQNYTEHNFEADFSLSKSFDSFDKSFDQQSSGGDNILGWA